MVGFFVCLIFFFFKKGPDNHHLWVFKAPGRYNVLWPVEMEELRKVKTHQNRKGHPSAL